MKIELSNGNTGGGSTSIPEPQIVTLLGIGLGAMAIMKRKMRINEESRYQENKNQEDSD